MRETIDSMKLELDKFRAGKISPGSLQGGIGAPGFIIIMLRVAHSVFACISTVPPHPTPNPLSFSLHSFPFLHTLLRMLYTLISPT